VVAPELIHHQGLISQTERRSNTDASSGDRKRVRGTTRGAARLRRDGLQRLLDGGVQLPRLPKILLDRGPRRGASATPAGTSSAATTAAAAASAALSR